MQIMLIFYRLPIKVGNGLKYINVSVLKKEKVLHNSPLNPLMDLDI